MKRFLEWVWWEFAASNDDKYDLLSSRIDRANKKLYPPPAYLNDPKTNNK